MNKLHGQTAVVTGSSDGIGQAIAIRMAEAGANVVVNYHADEQGALETLEAIIKAGGRGITVKADVSSETDVNTLFHAADEAFGRINILVNNAGIQKDSPFAEMSLEVWNEVINTNLTGSFLCSREAVKYFLRKGGSNGTPAKGIILFISSVHNVIPWAGHANYVASKGGETMLMKTLAQELAPMKIRVNSIAPGAIKTAINKEVWSDPQQYEQLLQMIPYGRIGEPADVAKLAVWLATDEADYITGANIYIDGGMTLFPMFMHGG
jgi:glucose 1-dehydrogenase